MSALVPVCVLPFIVSAGVLADPHPNAAEKITSLTNPAIKFSTADRHFVVLKRADVTAVIVDNEAVDVPDCPGHKAGYNGVAVLKRGERGENLFVPAFAGINFEHIHDGTRAIDKAERFEPRKAPMQLRIVDGFTVELHQPPTPNFKLENCGRYRLLDDGVLEYTFECIPRARTFAQGYIGLFWANYIQQPESTAIHFVGKKTGDERADWISSVSPRHGVDGTHPPARLPFDPRVDPEFSLTLVNHKSQYVYTEPWYYGISHGQAFAQLFRARDAVWFAQSPSGGGDGNPAWDFQWFIPGYNVDQAYGFVMRAALIPYGGQGDVVDRTRLHNAQLNPKTKPLK